MTGLRLRNENLGADRASGVGDRSGRPARISRAGAAISTAHARPRDTPRPRQPDGRGSGGREPHITALGRFVSVRRAAGALAAGTPAVTAAVMIVGFSPVISSARAASSPFVPTPGANVTPAVCTDGNANVAGPTHVLCCWSEVQPPTPLAATTR